MKRIPNTLFPALLFAAFWAMPVVAQRLAPAATRPADVVRAVSGTVIRTTAETLTLEETFVLNKDTTRPATLLPGEGIRVHYREENARHIAIKVESMLGTGEIPTAEFRAITGRVISSGRDRLTVETVFAMNRNTTKPAAMTAGESVRVQYRDEGTRHVAAVIEMAPAQRNSAPYRPVP